MRGTRSAPFIEDCLRNFIVRTRHVATAAAAIVIAIALSLSRGLFDEDARHAAAGADSFSFAALGDAPYDAWQEQPYARVLRELAAQQVGFVVHVGDITGSDCTRARYERTLDGFNGLPHPVIYTPGDNEWATCQGSDPDVEPFERLTLIRKLFFADPAHSLGGRRIRLRHQGEVGAHTEYVENARWWHDGVVFATVHLVGSWNGLGPDGGTAAAQAESRRRTRAAADWVRTTFVEARTRRARAVVIAFHADPAFEKPGSDAWRTSYEPWLSTLEAEAASFSPPILLVHGDSHDHRIDRPLRDRTTGRALDNVTRLIVPGHPDVGWVRVTVSNDPVAPFTFQPRVVPRPGR
jgi:hypothetical protein